MSKTALALALALVAIWGFFLFFGPPGITSVIAYSIAGWQVGAWASVLAKRVVDGT